jgi:hypothetical protein
MKRHYGRTAYYIIGEGLVDEESFFSNALAADSGSAAAATAPAMVESPSSTQVPEPKYKFGRMFTKLSHYRPNPQALIDLGKIMKAAPASNTGAGESADSNIPAGYTYLGQFIAHEITFDTSKGLPDVLPNDVANISTVEQGRSPSLDLDSLYGTEESERYLYEPDGIRLRVGKTAPDPFEIDPIQGTYEHDLPRRIDFPEGEIDGPQKPQEALTGDPRNDENLAVAQTHVAFIRFHNAVVEYLVNEKGLPRNELLSSIARKMVVQHFQSIVLQDYLPRVIDEEILASVIERKDNPEFFVLEDDEEPFMPVEFSAAAFRIGHSMIRDRYNWNAMFDSKMVGRGKAPVGQLFNFTGFRESPRMEKHLPSRWIIDWTRFYDFRGLGGVVNNPLSNRAKRIDTKFSWRLEDITGFPHHPKPEWQPITVRNLLRGYMLGLPSGQDVAEALKAREILAPEKIADEKAGHADVLKAHGFDVQTPLWYYILKEAELNKKKKLGEVGSRILAETFVVLLRKSRFSILEEPGWFPELSTRGPGLFGIKRFFGMADMLNFVNERHPDKLTTNPLPFLNPLKAELGE